MSFRDRREGLGPARQGGIAARTRLNERPWEDRPLRTIATIIAVTISLSGCSTAPAPEPDLAFDPLEAPNRDAHDLNVRLDTAVYGPVARSYGKAVPEEARRTISNLRNNWRLPGHAIQYALQGRGEEVAETTTRFAVNTLLGLGGLLDIATDMGLPYEETGFDEVFYRWGISEGGYLELPVAGPGTQRDWTGYVFDQVLDPTWYVLPVAAGNALLVLGGLDLVNDRYELDPVLDSLLYQSADSYAAQRTSYLQNRRAVLRGGTDIDTLEDIYADQ